MTTFIHIYQYNLSNKATAVFVGDKAESQRVSGLSPSFKLGFSLELSAQMSLMAYMVS